MSTMKTATSPPITEKTLRDRVLRQFPPHEALIAVNLCGIGPYPHEMDLVRVLPSGWACEYEIKVTAADIKADSRKTGKYQELYEGYETVVYRPYVGEYELDDDQLVEKAAETAQRSASGLYVARRPFNSYHRMPVPVVCERVDRPIKQFWVVVPTPELADVAIAHLPQWVGVVICEGTRWIEKRKAKLLPRSRKVTDEERTHIYKRMYSRYWQMYQQRGGAGRK